MVTIGTGDKIFSSGFDLKYWMADFHNNMMPSLLKFCQLMARLYEFPIPTMCVINGTAVAGGYFLSICHDFRIMHETRGNICLSELKLGLPIPAPYIEVITAKLEPEVVTKLSYAVTIKSPEALKDHLIDSTYTNQDDLKA